MGRSDCGLRHLRGWAAGVVVILGLVCGCAADIRTMAAPSSGVSEQVFAVGYSRIAEIYLKPVDLGRLASDGLAGLRVIDGSVRVERQPKTIRVSVGGRALGDFNRSGVDDAAGWAAVTMRAIERMRQVSAPLRDASSEHIYQAVFDAVVSDLDPYSRYTGVERAGNERAQREGYGGIGISIDRQGNSFVIRNVLAQGPAERAGVREKSLIMAIDGAPTLNMTVHEVRDHLRGAPGSQVSLTVLIPSEAFNNVNANNVSANNVSANNNNVSDSAVDAFVAVVAPIVGVSDVASTPVGQTLTITIRRERVIPNTVTATIQKQVGFFKIERFNASTSANLRAAVLSAKAALGAGARGYVLDLRGNPGGLLDQAVAVSELFIPHGRIISTRGRHPDSWQRFDANGEDLLEGAPLIVLVDGRSASASEVVAAALQDRSRAVVIGASSFGKGSVQTVTRLPNDGELFLTWSRIYAPSGYTLHRQGVQPTVCTSHSQRDAEEVLSPLRDGRLNVPAAFARWRAAAPEDENALARLRETCPWKAHEPELDWSVAEKMLNDQGLYQSALALAMTMVAER
ncbi:carboxyl-terminal processing protease [Azospirillaceae bacterium]